MKRMRTVFVILGLLPAPLAAQHDHNHSVYSDLDYDTAFTMTPEEVRQLRNGEGMGLALVAELNGYPGPKHAIELASELGLSPEQLARIESIQESMRSGAIEVGLELLATESELTTLFKSEEADPSRVAALTDRVGRITGKLRAIHLQAHLETRDQLTPQQVRLYNIHRGYD